LTTDRSRPKTALIFGAGKTGRGFAAHLAFLGGYEVVLIDKDKQLVSDLKKASQYDIHVLDNEKMSCTIIPSGTYQIDDTLWHEDFVKSSLVFTAVYGNNLAEIARDMAPALHKRYRENREQVLTIITCENLANAATLLKSEIIKNLDKENEEWLSRSVGFSEAIILRTCLEAGFDQSPLTVRAQNFFELPCDGDAIKEELGVYGLKPLKHFNNQLRRKIYTYNCINAVITYLGAIKGYSQLWQAGNDPAIHETAMKAANETSAALVAEFNFDKKEQQEWVNAAFLKFADKNVPDPIERNALDPVRKLGREDRLIGPALLAIKHGIFPEGILEGIIACFEYRDPTSNSRIYDVTLEKGPDFILTKICGLSMEEELFMLIKKQITKMNSDERK
jgi:mannitol-1-phosphate 5-dehydrogenase